MIRSVAVLGVGGLLAGCGHSGIADTSSAASPSLPAGVSARVVRVLDGDTVRVQGEQVGAVTVRVLGIDTPETVKPGYTVGCGGPEASAHAHQVLDGTTVTVIGDPTQDRVDRYGRTLAYLELADGSDYSVTTVAAGYGRAYTYDHRPGAKAARITAAQQQAQDVRAGIWGPPCHGNTDSTPTGH